MADKKNIVPRPLTLAVLSERIANVSRTFRGERGPAIYDGNDDLVYILYFKDRAVFSLNATGAFSDGIIRAVS